MLDAAPHDDDNPFEAKLAYLEHRLQTHGIHTLLVQFTDLHGVAKGKYVPAHHLRSVLTEGAAFAGAAVWGGALPRVGPRAEYHARADADTLQVLPWQPGYARMVCSGYVNGEPFDACSRQVLQRATARLAERGWTLRTGIEPEFFLLKRGPAGQWLPADEADRLPNPSYDLKSLPRAAEFLRALHSALEGWGLNVLQIDHEGASSQYEVNFAFDEALASADHLMGFKLAAHALAEAHGWVFSMMPKPFAHLAGSGMHFHASLWEQAPGGRNLFQPQPGEDDEGTGLSLLGRQFMAGVMAHAPGLCALAAPTVNSYKRLVAGDSLAHWAPAYLCHGPNNRTCAVRTLPGRFEWRVPDASANPYLATASLIAAGLDGIERGLDPGPACTDDLTAWPPARLRAQGFGLLPQSLGEALDALARDSVLYKALGETLFKEFIRTKREEWFAYTSHVSAWELTHYAAKF